MIGSCLNSTKERLTLCRSPIKYQWWRSNAAVLPLSFYPKDELCTDSQALRAGYPLTGGHRPNPEPRIRSHTELAEQHPGARTSKIRNSPAPRSQIGSRSGLKSTHPDTNDLSHIRQAPQETVHHYWARFLLVMNKVKDCREEDAISFFCNNCTDKGNLNAISRRDIAHFADLAAIVRKYCAMESAWKSQTQFWDNPALTKTPV